MILESRFTLSATLGMGILGPEGPKNDRVIDVMVIFGVILGECLLKAIIRLWSNYIDIVNGQTATENPIL
jgi:hypothetical protein